MSTATRGKFFAIAIVAIATISMAASTWKTWPDPIYDFGSQLYYPWRMDAGQHLYTDIAYFNGPFSQYFNAAIFAVMGVSLRSLILVNLAIVLGVIILIYRLIALLSGTLSAVCACVVFVVLFAFSRYVGIGNYNWICPYTHEVTHGVALSLLMIAAFTAFCRTEKKRWLVVAGMLWGLVFLTKAEVFVAAAAAVVAGLLLRARMVGFAKTIWQLPWFILPALTVIVIAFALLAIQLSTPVASRAVLGSWPWVFDSRIAQLQFYRQGIGIDDVAGNLWKMMVVGLAWFAIFATVLSTGLMPHRWRNIVFVLLGAELIGVVLLGPWCLQLARPWPVFLIVSLAMSKVQTGLLKQPRRSEVFVLRAMLTVFALGLMGKMLLNARIWQYGFALAMPAAIVLVEAMIGAMPMWIAWRGGSENRARWAAVATIAVVTGCLYAQQFPVGRETILVGSGPDQFVGGNRGVEVQQSIALIEKLLPAGGTLAVMPQGLMLNYQTRRANPIACVNMMPPEVISVGENRVIAELAAHPPDMILLSEKDIRDGAFVLTEGQYAYGRGIVAWVLAHYRPVVMSSRSSQLKLSYWMPQ